MNILGIDPGLATCGFGIIKADRKSYSLVECGIIRTYPEQPFPERLSNIYKAMNSIIRDFNAEKAGVEKLYFSRNTKTAMKVAQARGVIMLALNENSIPVFEFTPLSVKKRISGSGRADKKVIQNIIAGMLNLESPPKPDDAADAIAIAINTYYEVKSAL